MPDELQWFHNDTTGATIQILIPDGDASRAEYARHGWKPCDAPAEPESPDDVKVTTETPAAAEPQDTSEQDTTTSLDLKEK